MTYTDNDKQRMDWASLLVSGASLAVGVAALCMNEKGESMTERKENQSPAMQYKIAKQAKKDAYKERKTVKLNARVEKAKKQTMIREYAGGIGYDGPIILLNEKEYGLVPLQTSKPTQSWVAMEINSKNGSDRQAIVCGSKEEARTKAMKMKNAHRQGSKQSKDCEQGYARMDTTRSIDVGRWFAGKEGTLYRV